MNLLILENSEHIQNQSYILTGRKKDHLINHLNVLPGQRLKAGLVNHSLGEAIIQTILPNKIFIDYTVNEVIKLQKTQNFAIFFAFQRPQTIKKILHLAGCAGLNQINFFISAKSQKSYSTSPVWLYNNIHEELIKGMEQCGNILLPTVKILDTQPDFTQFNLKILLDTKGRFIKEKLFGVDGTDTAIVVGPEAGFRANEIDNYLANGFIQLKLSKLMLRTEFALAYLLARIETEYTP